MPLAFCTSVDQHLSVADGAASARSTAARQHATPPRGTGGADRLPAAAAPHAEPPAALHRIVVVGGGAGGLELAARLGDDLGRRGKAEIVLVDATLTHLWKPLLHEVAAGTLGPHANEFDFLQQAREHHFRFELGRLAAVDRARRQIWLAALVDEAGMEIAASRPISYATLVICIGAIDNDFGTPGVRTHAHSLNSKADAERFHRRLLALCARAELGAGEAVRVAIVGGGATGVELAAELASAADIIASYGVQLAQLRQPLRITLIEMERRVLSALPADVAARVHADLTARGIDVRLNRRVAAVDAEGIVLEGGERIASELTVWAAGVRGQEILQTLDGLAINRQGQLLVLPTLQTTEDDNVFAFGDCASCRPRLAARPVPPTAQAAGQQAKLLALSLRRRIAGKEPLLFIYEERGSIVSLGDDEAVGKVTTRWGHELTVRGVAARFTYWILYRRHLALLLGSIRTVILTLGQWLSTRSQPRVKLH
jgi:NADH dehydrogenase